MMTETRGLDQCVDRMHEGLGRLRVGADDTSQVSFLRAAFRDIMEEIKGEIVASLERSAPSQITGSSLIERHGWKDLYIRSFSFWFMFYVAWMWTQFGVKLRGRDLERLFNVWVHGSFGYRLLDLHLDEASATDQEAIAGLWLIAEHEKGLLDFFGHEQQVLQHIQRAKTEWCAAELQEKSQRGKSCPIPSENPVACADKAAPIFVLFALALERYGTASLVPTYKKLIYRLVATTQLLDDLSDLEDDIANGFFTIPCNGLEDTLRTLPPAQAAGLVRADAVRMRQLCDTCCALAAEASSMAEMVDDPLFEVLAESRIFMLRTLFFQGGDPCRTSSAK